MASLKAALFDLFYNTVPRFVLGAPFAHDYPEITNLG